MAYTGFIRAVSHRVQIGGKRVKLSAPTTISETLENATTSVADITLADPAAVNYTRGQQVVIDHLRVTNSDRRARHRMQTLFKGIVDSVSATSHPNDVRVRAVGVLGNLRLTTDEDIDLTGMTDQQAVMQVLDVCKIGYSSANIAGAGYVLGAEEPVIWTAGSSGAQMVEELDRVFGYATIENGNGDVQRIKYSRVPNDYGSVVAGRSFYRGQPGVTFYANSRTRGQIDKIINYWKINGLEYEIGDTAVDGDGDGIEQEGKEGCARRVWAECKSEQHRLLGPGVYVGGDFSSDLIQDSGLAKAICIRMMEWYNREQDTLRIECGNDPAITVGDVIEVKDGAPGIDLGRRQRYLVTSIQRTGDLMTLDCIGGDAGDVGAYSGGIEECCGTWADDGTCTPNEQDDIEEPPPMPDLPELPEDPTEEWCDPSLDPSCLPDDGEEDATDPEGPKRPERPAPVVPPDNTEDAATCSSRGILGCATAADTCYDDGLAWGSPGGGAGEPAWPCAPSGVVPFGEITGGMEWSLINQWDELLWDASQTHGVTASRLKAMIVIESGGNPDAVGVGGAVGLLQVKPAIWQAEADTFGYDLYTAEGQIFMAAAIIGGDVDATTGMTEEQAFLSVYYPVYDAEGELCLTCVGESGHTPQQYLDDLDLFMGVIEAACPQPSPVEPGSPATPESQTPITSVASFTGGTGGSTGVNILATPVDVLRDGSRIYVSDGYGSFYSKVSAFNATTYAREMVYGQSDLTSSRPASALTNPRGIGVYGGKLYVVDAGKNAVMVYDVATGTYERQFGNATRLPAPYGIAFDPINPGQCVISDISSKKLLRYDATNGSFVAEYAGAAFFGADGPRGLDFGEDGTLYVCDRTGKRVQIFTNAGVNTGSFGAAGTGVGQFNSPNWLAVRGSSVYVLDRNTATYDHRVQRWTTAGVYQEQWAGVSLSDPIATKKLGAPIGIAASTDNLYVTDGDFGTGTQSVRVFATTYTPPSPEVPGEGCTRPAWHAITDSNCDYRTHFSATASTQVYVDADAYVTKIGASSGSATITYSENEVEPNASLATVDRLRSTGLVCIGGKARFAASGGSVTIALEGWTEAGAAQATPATAEPSSTITLYGQGGAVGYAISHHGVGVSGGTPAALNADHTFDVCLDFDDAAEPVTVTGGFGTGTLAIAAPDCLADFHSVKITAQAAGAAVSGAPSTQVWDVTITGVGAQTCGENPHYAPAAPPTAPVIEDGPVCGPGYQIAIDCASAEGGVCIGDYAEDAPAGVCATEQWIPVESSTCLFNQPFRLTNGAAYYYVGADSTVERLGLVKQYGGSTRSAEVAYVSTILNSGVAAEASDATFQRGVICVSGMVRFGLPGCRLRIALRQRTTGNAPIALNHAATQFYATPGDTSLPSYPPEGISVAYGVRIDNHGNSYGQFGACGPHEATGPTCFNMGGRAGEPLPTNTDLPFQTCWDSLAADNYATWQIGSQRGYLQWQEIPGAPLMTHAVCSDDATYQYATYPWAGHDLRLELTCADTDQWNYADVGTVGMEVWNIGFNDDSTETTSDCVITSQPTDDLG